MFAALLLALLSAAPADDFKAGAASVDITPPVGTPMAGYYAERLSQGVHDPLYAKAVVMESGGKKAALVCLDLISTTAPMVDEARREIEKTTGVPGADVMISATHAHTGPVLQGRGPREDAFGGKNPLARKYGEELPGKIAEAVRRAEKALRPAKVAAGHGRESSIAFNRRFHMTDGTVGWNPGKLNPKILKPAGTIDPDVAVVYFEAADKDRTPLADLRQLRRAPGQRRRRAVLRRHAGHRRRPPRPVQGPRHGDALQRRLLRRHQSHRRALGRAPGRPRERRPDGRDPRGRGAADLAQRSSPKRPAPSA